MQQTSNSLMSFPGGENEGGSTEPKNEDVKADDLQLDATDAAPKEKGIIDKLKDALKEWSNDDQQEQDIDDATP
jgi:hypothetical protein